MGSDCDVRISAQQPVSRTGHHPQKTIIRARVMDGDPVSRLSRRAAASLVRPWRSTMPP